MSTQEIANRLVELCNAGRAEDAIAELYADNIVSIEPQGSDVMPARMEGIDAIRRKNQWWTDNHEVHSAIAEGPFIGNRPDRFVVRFAIDVTEKGGARSQVTETGIYRVADNRIVEEEFLYLA